MIKQRPAEQFDADGPEVQRQAEKDVLDCDIEPPRKLARTATGSATREDFASLAFTRAMETSRLKRHASNASSWADDEASNANATAGGDTHASQATTITTFVEDFTYCPEADDDDVPLSQSLQDTQDQDHQDPPPLWQSLQAPPSTIVPLVDEIGTAGCIFGNDARAGVVVDSGFPFLVRIALRCVNLSPRHMQERLVLKYASHGAVSEKMSTTYSGTDAIVDAKLAVIIAVRMKVGLQTDVNGFCGFALQQVLAAERDEWKRDMAIINRPRHASHAIGAVAKALVCLFVCLFACLFVCLLCVVCRSWLLLTLSVCVCVCVCVSLVITIHRMRTDWLEGQLMMLSQTRRSSCPVVISTMAACRARVCRCFWARSSRLARRAFRTAQASLARATSMRGSSLSRRRPFWPSPPTQR